MSEYIRTTRECSVNQFRPELLQAIQNYFQEHQLGNLQADVLMCCETISRKKSVSNTVSWLHKSQPDTIIYTAMLLTSQWLIWVKQGDRSGILTNAAKLHQLRAEFYVFPFTKDAGLEIVGYLQDTNNRVHGYIGMGTDLAARKFCEQVKEAIARVNPPTKKDFRWWAG